MKSTLLKLLRLQTRWGLGVALLFGLTVTAAAQGPASSSADVQREAMRKVAPDIKKGLSELPMARLGTRFREAALEAIAAQQKAFAASARDLAAAFEKLADESLKAISEVTRRTFEELQKEAGGKEKRLSRRPKAGKKR